MDAKETFQQKYAEEMGKVVKPTILVCGYTGAGKTSLFKPFVGRIRCRMTKSGTESP